MEILARSVVKTYFVGFVVSNILCFLNVLSKLENLMLATSLSSQVHQLIEELYELPGIFNPQVKQHFCIASCRLMTCICCYTLPLQSSKFNHIYVFLTQKAQTGLVLFVA